MIQQSPTERASAVLSAALKVAQMPFVASVVAKGSNIDVPSHIAVTAMVEFASQAAQPAEADGCEIEKIEVAFNAWNDGDISKGYGDRYRGFIAGYRAATPKAPATDAGEEGDVFVVALALSKAGAGVTTYSMSQSWRKGGTEQEAIDAAHLFAAKEKPGFGVWETLVTRIAAPATPPAPNDDLRAALEEYRRWKNATDRHAELLGETDDVTAPNIVRSGQRCAALYASLSSLAIAHIAALKENRRG